MLQALLTASVIYYGGRWLPELGTYGNLLQLPYWARCCGWALLVGSLVLLLVPIVVLIVADILDGQYNVFEVVHVRVFSRTISDARAQHGHGGPVARS